MNEVREILQSLRRVLYLHRDQVCNVMVQLDDILLNWEEEYSEKIFNFIRLTATDYLQVIKHFVQMDPVELMNMNTIVNINKEYFTYIREELHRLFRVIRDGV